MSPTPAVAGAWAIGSIPGGCLVADLAREALGAAQLLAQLGAALAGAIGKALQAVAGLGP